MVISLPKSEPKFFIQLVSKILSGFIPNRHKKMIKDKSATTTWFLFVLKKLTNRNRIKVLKNKVTPFKFTTICGDIYKFLNFYEKSCEFSNCTVLYNLKQFLMKEPEVKNAIIIPLYKDWDCLEILLTKIEGVIK